MKIDYRLLANKNIRELSLYQPGKPLDELQNEYGITTPIKLASNENPLGPSPNVIKAIHEILPFAHIYPDGNCYELKKCLAQMHNVESSQITIGNGSENILELIIKAYLSSTANAIISEYAFLTIPLLLQAYGANIKTIPARNWGHDLAATLAAIDDKTRCIFLVNPSNPTGTYISEEEFLQFINRVPANVLVVVDEAYSEYIANTDYPQAAKFLPHYPNLIITRTFSKIYGLAALRIGYGLSIPEIAEILNKARLPFNVNAIAAKAAKISLEDHDHVSKSIQTNNDGMAYLELELQKLNYGFIPSIGNFISIDVCDGEKAYQYFLRKGIIVRPLSSYNMPRHIRVTVGTPAENEIFIAALAALSAA